MADRVKLERDHLACLPFILLFIGLVEFASGMILLLLNLAGLGWWGGMALSFVVSAGGLAGFWLMVRPPRDEAL